MSGYGALEESGPELVVNESTDSQHFEELDLPDAASKNTSAGSALFNFLKGNIGTGILALPVAFKHAGLWLGFFLLLFYGCLSTYLMHVLLKITDEIVEEHDLDQSTIDYTEAIFNIVKYGPEPLRKYKGKVKHTINAFLLLTQIGFCCIYILFATQNIKYFIESKWPGTSANLYLIGIIVTILLMCLNIKITMRVFAIPSMIALAATAFGLVLIFVYIFSTGLKDQSSLPAYQSFDQVLTSLGIFIFTFEGVALTLPIKNRMREPDLFVAPFGVLNTSMVICICLSLSIGFFGYLCFGDDILGSITYNIPNSPAIYSAVKPLFTLAIFLTYMLQFYVPARILGRLMLKLAWHRDSTPRWQSFHRKVMRLLVILLTYGVAVVVPHLDLMVSLLGAVSSSALALLVPPAADLLHRWPRRGPNFLLRVVLKDAVFFAIGLGSAVLGTVATVVQIIHVMKNP